MTLTAPKWGRSQSSRPMQRSGRYHKLRGIPATDQAIRGDKPRVWDDPAVR